MLEHQLDGDDEQKRADETEPGEFRCEHDERAENNRGEEERTERSSGNHRRNDEGSDRAARDVEDCDGDDLDRAGTGERRGENADEARGYESGRQEQHLCVGALTRIEPDGDPAAEMKVLPNRRF